MPRRGPGAPLDEGRARGSFLSESLQARFERARSLGATEREHYLAGLEADGSELAGRLRALLAAADSGVSPLDSDPWSREPGDSDEDVEIPLPLPERIGPYRVLSEIGRGGMGRVFLALQEGEGFSRRLAVKVMAMERPDAEVERRFRDERRILATLEHPGIARFHDAGRDATGRWFLALEYVEGVDLVAHCRARRLALEERLRLFHAVLEAVAYAHARGVVHRDLKPGNILVGSDGRPRLLDFGIAKLLEPEPAANPAETHTTLRVFTPAYASPEQFRGDPATPRSDVFSLGVLLYELISGSRPFGDERGSHAAFERAVLASDPPPPSAVPPPQSNPLEASPNPSARRLAARDLDVICLKALRKEPTERYSSAAEFAAEVAHLLAGRPVAARAEDRRYRIFRLLHRRGAALALAAALAIAAIAVTIVLQAGHDTASAAEPAPRPFPFSGIAGKDAAALEKEFIASPASVAAGARLAIALDKSGRRDEATLILARLRQIPGRAEDPLIDYVEATTAASAGELQRGLVLYGVALERAIAGGRGELVAQIRAARGWLLHNLGRPDEAKADMELARRDFESSGDNASLARVLNDLAIEPLRKGRLAEGEALLERALAAARAAGAGSGGIISGNLATVSLQRGRPDRAAARFREAIALFESSRSSKLSWARMSLGDALRDLGRIEEADRELAAGIDLQKGAPSDRIGAYAYMLFGSAELARGHLPRVEASALQLAALARHSGDRTAMALSQQLRGELAAARGDVATGRGLLSEARRLLREDGEADWQQAATLAAAEIEEQYGELAAAGALASEAAQREGTAIETTVAFLCEALLVRIDVASGRLEEARRRLHELEAAAAETTSIRRRIALRRARAALALGERDLTGAARELAGAGELARSAGRQVEALTVDLSRARLDLARGENLAAAAAAEAVARAATDLGWVRLASEASGVAGGAAVPDSSQPDGSAAQ